MILDVRMCVCVCACACERERERERQHKENVTSNQNYIDQFILRAV